MERFIAALILLTITTTAFAGHDIDATPHNLNEPANYKLWHPMSEWTPKQRHKSYAAYSLLAIDYLQTRDLVKNPSFKEMNKFLGPNPSMGRISQHFAISALLYHTIFSMTKPQYRDLMLNVVIITEGINVSRNAYLGVGLEF